MKTLIDGVLDYVPTYANVRVRRKGWGSIAALFTAAALLTACGPTDRYRTLADNVIMEAESNACRAARATALAQVSAELWPDQKWEQAAAAAQLMADNADAPKFDVLAQNFTYQYLTPLVSQAVRTGVDAAGGVGTVAARLLTEGMGLVERLPNGALALGRVRAATAQCVAGEAVAIRG